MRTHLCILVFALLVFPLTVPFSAGDVPKKSVKQKQADKSVSRAQSSAPVIDYERRFHPVIGRSGIVASQESRASAIGLQVLKNGGNAADAAVATAYALCVTLPKAGNLGGGGFLLYYSAKDKKTFAIDFRETAPAAAHRDMYLNDQGKVDQALARFSPQSIGVPGTVRGLSAIHSRFASLPLKSLMKPAIRLAKEGIIVSPGLASDLSNYEKRLKTCPAIAKIFYKKNGELYRFGETLVQSDLAWSLEQIADQGAEAFYEGDIAEKLLAFMKEKGGLITASDLRSYRIAERTPVTGAYKGCQIVSMPPPSSGGIHLIQMLNVLENTSLAETGHNSARSIHLLAETMKYAFADRSRHLGDSDFYPVPVPWLTSKRYGKEIFNQIEPGKARPSSEIRPGIETGHEDEDTTHFSIMDRFGNAASLTYTLNYSFGSRQMAEGTGILLNNEMDDFSAKPGAANGFGLIGGKANAIESGKRPLSSMTPTIVFRNRSPYLVTGSPGGSKIITSVLQLILNVVEHKMNIAEASTSPRIHHQWIPDALKCEKGISIDTIQILNTSGHKTEATTSLGCTQSVMKIEDRFEGFSDPRRPGAATVAY